MAFPIALLLLGGAGLGGLYLLSKGDKEEPKSPTKPSGPQAPQANVMPGALKTAIDQMLNNPNVNPDDLDHMAVELDKYGFTTEATSLRMKATQLRSQRPLPPPLRPTPSPIVQEIPLPRPQDLPFPAPIPVPQELPPTPLEQPIEPPPPPPPPPPSPAMQDYAVATTDVYVRSTPSNKGAVVSQEMRTGVRALVLQRDVPAAVGDTSGVGVWTQVRTPAGVQGYMAQKFVRFESSPSTSGRSPVVIGSKVTRSRAPRSAACLCPTGCKLRAAPSGNAQDLDIIPSGAYVKVLGHVAGSKVSALSPGPGGYLHVEHDGKRGWASSEWFQLT